MIIFSLTFTLWSVVSSAGVQTLGVRITAAYLSKAWKTEVRIQSFSLNPWDGLVIIGISLKDRYGEYALSAKELSVRPGIINLKKHKINLEQVFIDKGIVQLLVHKGDTSLNIQPFIDYFATKDTTRKTDTVKGKPWDLTISNVILNSTRFHFENKNIERVPVGMDYANIDVNDINLDMTDLRFDADTIRANIRDLSAKERSGFHVQHLSGEFHVSPGFLKANNLKVLTDNSDLSLSFAFLYPTWSAYNDFLNAITIKADIAPTYLDLQDIGFFAPEIRRMKDRFRFEGKIDGTVSNFRARDFRIAYGTNTYFWGNIRAFGLPDVKETFVDMAVKSMTTNKQDIESFLLPGEDDSIALPGILANIGVLSFNGNFTGYYNDFVSNALFRTNLGNIRTDLIMHRTHDEYKLSYQGQIDVSGFDIGKLTGDSAYVGVTTFRGEIKGKGLSSANADVELNVHVDSTRLLKYNYHKLDIRGLLFNKRFTGYLDVADTNLALNFVGMMNFSDSIPGFDFNADLQHAQLFNLGFMHRDSTEILASVIKANFTGNKLDNINGYIGLENTNYVEGSKSIHMKNLLLTNATNEKGDKSYHLKSDFVDADMSGNFSFKQVVPSLYIFIKNYLASFYLKDSAKYEALVTSGQVLKCNARFKNTDQLTNIFIPFLKVSGDATLEGSYDELKGLLSIRGQAPFLDVSGIYIPNWYVEAQTSRRELTLNTGSDAVYFKKASKNDSVEVKLDTFKLRSHIHHDTIMYALSWTEGGRLSGFDGYVSFLNNPKTEIKITNMGVLLNNREWTVDRDNYITIDTNFIDIHRLFFTGGDQFLEADGKVSGRPQDTLYLAFNKVDISSFDRLTGSTAIDIEGMLSGKVKLMNVSRDIRILSDLKLDQFKFNKELLGDAILNVNYIKADNRFDVRSRIEYTGNVGKNIPFDLNGSFYAGKEPRLDFSLDLKNLNLKMLQPFVKSFMSGLNGWASGHATIKGTLEKPRISGDLTLSRTELKISYLNVMYSLADVVHIDSNAFVFNKITLYDSLGNKGTLSGRISHEYFRDMRIDLHVDLNNFSAFNNSYAQNQLFYGKARGTGSVHIFGPIDNISIVVKAQTGKNTNVAIPINLTASVGQNDFIQFVNNKDTLAFMEAAKKDQTKLNLDIALKVNPEAQVEVFLPDQLGNLKAQGTGNIVMGLTPATPFNMTGTYTITKGSFVFQIKNLLRLPMSITEGSRITWSGDPADANLSVTAIYRTKTTLAGLTSEPSEAQIRFPVEVIFHLGGKLSNPDIKFSMNLPNVEEDIKIIVYRSIDTTNVSEMNQQMLYLLVMNSFKPVVSTGSALNVGATSVSLVTNQINSWLSGISRNVNLGVNYRPGSSTDIQAWDVSMSTQLMNNRLLIDGTFGMNNYKSSPYQQPNQIVGDINIEYLFTKNNRWRVRAFNRTNNVNILLNNNSPYTQGVGLKYQRDFYTFGELFHGKDWAEKKDQEARKAKKAKKK
ncbi:MAG: translocation/assembly module TamB domain-containing protein [Bacteroidetes bacterium]|nr:translocation/assembly module TamB domain-containing protein [Bacteroidota bacterium]